MIGRRVKVHVDYMGSQIEPWWQDAIGKVTGVAMEGGFGQTLYVDITSPDDGRVFRISIHDSWLTPVDNECIIL